MTYYTKSHNSNLCNFQFGNHVLASRMLIEDNNNLLSKIENEYFSVPYISTYHHLIFEIVDIILFWFFFSNN